MSSTPTAGARQILAASFPTPDGASPDKLGGRRGSPCAQGGRALQRSRTRLL